MFLSYSTVPLVARCHPMAAELARAWRITNSEICVTMPMLPELCDFVTCGWIEPSNRRVCEITRIRDRPATVFSFRGVIAWRTSPQCTFLLEGSRCSAEKSGWSTRSERLINLIDASAHDGFTMLAALGCAYDHFSGRSLGTRLKMDKL